MQRALIGTTLSHYTVVAELGQGGMGEVYLAEDTNLGRKVALKVLSRDLVGDADRLKRLEREARSLAALDHPNIVPVYSFEADRGLHFLTMAFIDGHALDRLIPGEGMEFGELLELAIPLADALRAAHKNGIVHRDLKPANVMIDRDGRPRVLDFGLAKRSALSSDALHDMTTVDGCDQVTSEGTIVGTFPYMSPEQAEGKRVDERSDLFSFGVMLYEMACGRRPFEGDSAISIISAILRAHQRPICELRPGLPGTFEAIVARCLEKDPARRYQTAEELRADLEALRNMVDGGGAEPPPWAAPTVASPAGPVQSPARRGTSRRRVLRAAAAIAAAALAVTVGWRLWPTGRELHTLAVLPLTNSQENPDTEYLCEGVTETLIRQLSAAPSVRVTPLSAVLSLQGRGLAAVESGRTLGAGMVLTGTLEQQADRVHISAELLDVGSGTSLWTDSFDCPADDVRGVQEEIASAVLKVGLRPELSAQERDALAHSPTTSGEAYDLYLQARYIQRRSTEDDYLHAMELLRRAIVRDPRFAQAHLVLAGIHEMMAIDGYQRPIDAWAQANRLIHQALALDPGLPDAHASRHAMAFFFDWDWEGAARERRLAMRQPVGEFDPDFLRTFSLELLALGHPEDALAMARRARELDPLSIGLAMLEADYLVRVGRLDDAVALYQHTISVEPDNPEQYFGLAEARLEQGHVDEAIEARQRAHSLAGDDEIASLFAAARGEQGYQEADRAWVAAQLVWLEARSTWGYVSPLDLARAHAQLGETEKAFEYLDQAFADRAPGLVFLNVDRAWDSVRDDPRFVAAVHRVGLPTSS